MSYVGMLLQTVSRANLKQRDREICLRQKLVFAGFNALSKAEEIIFKELLDQGKATIYWDADRLYMGQSTGKRQEKFMRTNYKSWPPSAQVHWVFSDMLKQSKKIRMIGGVQAVGQS